MLYESRQAVIKLFNEYSSTASQSKHKAKYGEGLKILSPKQMLQRFPIALAQVKAGDTFENLLNEIRQIIYSFYREKEITKQVYNNIMNLIELQNMDTIFMNSEKNKTSDSHRLLVNLSDKINLKRSDKYVASGKHKKVIEQQ